MNDETSFADRASKMAQDGAAFQKMWLETFSKLIHAGVTLTPDAAPPELLRQIRSGIFKALSESWDEFLRSPQFMETMKQWMDTAINLRQMSNDVLTRARHEMQAPSREDIDTIMISVRHMERRILDQLEDLGRQVAQLQQSSRPARSARPAATARPRRAATKKRTQAKS